MIHILIGGDAKNKSIYIKELTKNYESFFIGENILDKEVIMSYCYNVDLFNKTKSIILENVLSDEEIVFKTGDIVSLKEAKTMFIFKEDKLLKTLQDKYKKYALIKVFEEKKIINKEKFKVFDMTDAFARKDKINTWTLYNKSIREGIEPEALAGVLFWKIKTMILSGSNIFNIKELRHLSSKIISLYHKAHRGESDLSIGLEQFILTSLSSK